MMPAFWYNSESKKRQRVSENESHTDSPFLVIKVEICLITSE